MSLPRGISGTIIWFCDAQRRTHLLSLPRRLVSDASTPRAVLGSLGCTWWRKTHISDASGVGDVHDIILATSNARILPTVTQASLRRSDPLPVGVLKSNLQKAMRRARVPEALATMKYLLRNQVSEGLRRLPVIIAEDCALDVSTYPFIVWLMCATSGTDGWTATPEDEEAVLRCVASAATSTYRYDAYGTVPADLLARREEAMLGAWNASFGQDWTARLPTPYSLRSGQLELSTKPSIGEDHSGYKVEEEGVGGCEDNDFILRRDCCFALWVRAAFGGMQGDVLMLMHLCRQMARGLVPAEGLSGRSVRPQGGEIGRWRATEGHGGGELDKDGRGGEGCSHGKRRRVPEAEDEEGDGSSDTWGISSSQLVIPAFDPLVHVLPEAIDSHCHPTVLAELWKQMQMDLDGALKDRYMKLWKDLIWTHSSGVNQRRVESIVGDVPQAFVPAAPDPEFELIRDTLLAVQWRFIEESLGTVAATAGAEGSRTQNIQSTMFAFFGTKKVRS